MDQGRIPIIIVGYRNKDDIVGCLKALRELVEKPKFDVYICENGGAAAYEDLVRAMREQNGLCGPGEPFRKSEFFDKQVVRVRAFTLHRANTHVLVAEAEENLGYAGAINVWLRIFMRSSSNWPGVWILNPDTEPDRRALAELVNWAEVRKIGMVGSRIVRMDRPDCIHSRGLRWRRLHSSAEAVDYLAPAGIEPDPDVVERRIDAPSGASIYVTRECLNKIGVMDDRYFLYFEDLDWGFCAKMCCGIGYAYKSIVPHRVGTTIGTPRGRRGSSRLSVYLEFRNRIHFVRKYYRFWLLWTVFVLFVRGVEYSIIGEPANMRAALNGLLAGLAGKTGRPDWMLH